MHDTAQPVWTEMGTVGTPLLGIWLFRETADLPRLLCILLVVAGMAGLKLLPPRGGGCLDTQLGLG